MGTYEALGQELSDLAALFQGSTELRQTLVNPVFKPSEKRAILEKILPRVTPSPIVQRFALLLLERGRIVLLTVAGARLPRAGRRARRPRARRRHLGGAAGARGSRAGAQIAGAPHQEDGHARGRGRSRI